MRHPGRLAHHGHCGHEEGQAPAAHHDAHRFSQRGVTAVGERTAQCQHSARTGRENSVSALNVMLHYTLYLCLSVSVSVSVCLSVCLSVCVSVSLCLCLSLSLSLNAIFLCIHLIYSLSFQSIFNDFCCSCMFITINSSI